MKFIFRILIITSLLAIASCSNAKSNTAAAESKPSAQAITSISFDADSAYDYIAKQVAFGPRVPGSQASEQCGTWIVEKLRQFGASDIKEQRTTLRAYNGDMLNARNISASLYPELPKRVLLLAHWDSRPWADQEPDAQKREQPIDGANDGASGVGVILELVRNISANKPSVGIDVLMVDAEDYGRRADAESDEETSDDSWALGTQYWVNDPTLDLSKIEYAILFDIVGGKGATFPREYISQRYSGGINDQIWKAAQTAGFSDRFPNKIGGAIVDDHVYLIQNGIPAIDIIENAHPATGSFPPYWHTHDDNMSNIDRSTLKAVGQTIIQHLYDKK